MSCGSLFIPCSQNGGPLHIPYQNNLTLRGLRLQSRLPRWTDMLATIARRDRARLFWFWRFQHGLLHSSRERPSQKAEIVLGKLLLAGIEWWNLLVHDLHCVRLSHHGWWMGRRLCHAWRWQMWRRASDVDPKVPWNGKAVWNYWKSKLWWSNQSLRHQSLLLLDQQPTPWIENLWLYQIQPTLGTDDQPWQVWNPTIWSTKSISEWREMSFTAASSQTWVWNLSNSLTSEKLWHIAHTSFLIVIFVKRQKWYRFEHAGRISTMKPITGASTTDNWW